MICTSPTKFSFPHDLSWFKYFNKATLTHCGDAGRWKKLGVQLVKGGQIIPTTLQERGVIKSKLHMMVCIWYSIMIKKFPVQVFHFLVEKFQKCNAVFLPKCKLWKTFTFTQVESISLLGRNYFATLHAWEAVLSSSTVHTDKM